MQNNFYYKRNMYLNRIEPFMGTHLIKVITGMRRTGKSVFLLQVKEMLR